MGLGMESLQRCLMVGMRATSTLLVTFFSACLIHAMGTTCLLTGTSQYQLKVKNCLEANGGQWSTANVRPHQAFYCCYLTMGLLECHNEYTMVYTENMCSDFNIHRQSNTPFAQQKTCLTYFPTYALKAIDGKLVKAGSLITPYYCDKHQLSVRKRFPGEWNNHV